MFLKLQKHFLSIYCMPRTLLDAGDSKKNNMLQLHSQEGTSSVGIARE